MRLRRGKQEGSGKGAVADQHDFKRKWGWGGPARDGQGDPALAEQMRSPTAWCDDITLGPSGSAGQVCAHLRCLRHPVRRQPLLIGAEGPVRTLLGSSDVLLHSNLRRGSVWARINDTEDECCSGQFGASHR